MSQGSHLVSQPPFHSAFLLYIVWEGARGHMTESHRKAEVHEAVSRRSLPIMSRDLC